MNIGVIGAGYVGLSTTAAPVDLLPDLQSRDARVRACDPEAAAAALPPQAVLPRNAYEAVRDADGVIVLTEQPAFETLDLARPLARGRLMVDCRNLFLPHEASGTGLDYVAPGRPSLVGQEHRDLQLGAAGAGADGGPFQSPPVP